MSVESTARAHQRSINNITSAAVVEADKAWRMVDVDNLDQSWGVVAPRAVALVGAAQVAVAGQSDAYLSGLAREYGVKVSPLGKINPNGFRDYTGSGTNLNRYLTGSVIAVKQLIGNGWAPAEAYQSGRKRFAQSVITTVGDQARQSTSAAMGVRASGLQQGWIGGYVRQVSAKACARCLILAGKRYATAEPFERHPGCLCTHIPAAENVDDDPTTDVKAAFESMTEAEQNARFGKANAEAIRQGADINQVVNATRSGSVYAADGARYTRAGTTRRGSYGRTSKEARMTPETIMRTARKDPEEVVRLLRQYKYIL